jgi:glycosyltransferase involved in cell wall biosynthesis
MKSIDVSIIIPCFNGSKFLPKLAESLRPLLTDRVEIILVDDGSTDGSPELFQKLLPEAICLKQTNSGPGAARNRGADKARGEFLQLLDADDTLEPGKFAAQVTFARERKLDVVYSDWRMVVVDGDSVVVEPWVRAEARKEIVEALLGGWWFSTGAALVRAKAYQATGGCDETLLNTCDDFDLWVRLGIAGFRFGYVPGQFANYYRYKRVRSISRADRKNFLEGESRIILKAVALLEKQGEATPVRRRAAAKRLHAVARNVFVIDKSWYRELMREVRRLDPEFKPVGSLIYRLTSKCLGMETAENLAVWKRNLV